MNMTSAVQTPTETKEAITGDLCWLLSRASHALMTEFSAALEDFELSPREHGVLSTAMGGEHTQTELARMIGLDKTTMVVTVDELEAAARSTRLWQLVDTLPPTQAELLGRAYVRGQTHQEIARETGLPLGTVKSRIRLGLDKLRYALGGRYAA